MKLLNIILLSSILIFSSCSKDEDSSPSTPSTSDNTSTNETTDGHKGSYTMTIDGATFTHLQNDITLLNHSLQIPGLDNNGKGFVFQSSGTIGEVGETIHICIDECSPSITTTLMLEENNGADNFNATSGSYTRISEYKVEISLTEDFDDGNARTLTATVNIGVIINT